MPQHRTLQRKRNICLELLYIISQNNFYYPNFLCDTKFNVSKGFLIFTFKVIANCCIK